MWLVGDEISMQLGLTLRVGGATRTEQQRQCQR
eukprot:COSAG02_NODE_22152_length_761_cov_882.305136_1_plen_32_part_10